MPPWKHRRKLIYASCILAAGMIIFAAVIYRSDTQVATQLIVGGVALLSIVLTAYTAFATYEDVKLWQPQEMIEKFTEGKTEDGTEESVS